jgi:Ser/Thr protein kinase RdoA (MazF antagonist)
VRAFPGGGTLRRIDAIWYSLSDRRGGRAPDELDEALAQRLGMLVGRLHNTGARRDAPHRLRLEPGVYVRRELDWLESRCVVPASLSGRYFAAARAIADLAEERLAGVAVHRIHADLHLGNLLLREERTPDGGGWMPVLNLLDFDDMAVGPAVQDLWLALPGRDPDTLRLREEFLAGYERFRAFDRSTLALIEPLRGMRIIHYAVWLARRWHDPAFPAAWPHFGTADAWRRETEDLEEQLARIRGEIAAEEETAGVRREGSEAVAEAAELTNKDFFWDWEG